MNYNSPRLLVATEFPPNASGGGPAVVRQMLKDWPSERLFWWSCLADRDRRFGRAVSMHRVSSVRARLYPQRRCTTIKSWIMENIWTPFATAHFQKTLDLFQPDVVWVIPHIWAILPLAAILPGSRTAFHATMQDYPDSNNN